MTWIIVAGVALLFRYQFLDLYANGDSAVISAGIARMNIIATTYILCGYMDTICGAVRAMGKSFTTMVFTLIGVVGVRILWINTVFQKFNTPISIYLSYPVSWIFSIAFNLTIFLIVYKKAVKTGTLDENEFAFLKRKKKKAEIK